MMNSRGFEFRLVLVKEYIRESLEDGQVGGKWAADGTYNSGETRCCRIDFEEPTFRMLDSSFLGSIVQLMFILSIYGLEHPATPIALLIFFDRHHEGEFEFGEKVEIKKVPVGLKSKGERVYSGVAGRWTEEFIFVYRLEENGQQMEHTIVVKQDVVGLILKNQLLECLIPASLAPLFS
ncbi:hypothetical protein F2Q68_00031688 [Brassica cretica]|uniref:Uncharacterized protein n=1 Tax=Brassica cretica TaxID=69181 RepID=A0A8S9G488_BRACR|nr:hypothetical protein F2Q68_00031688 [Brassica cretica]